MRARAAVSAALASAGILLAGWQSGIHVADTRSTAAAASAPANGSTGTGSAGTGGAAQVGGTYPGAVVETRFGSVQVQITVAAGTITDVTALKLTDAERKSAQINNRAAPLLRSEVLQAQSGDVQTISGATVTSDAYLTSLQSALDAANL